MPMPATVYRFGPYELRTRTLELYKHGTRLKLRPQPFQILNALLQRQEDVVTREELRELLWSSETFVDFEHGLNTSIKELRSLLSDSASQPRYIETLPRRGYRFIARVEEVQTPSIFAENSKETGEALEAPTRTNSLARLVLALLSSCAIALAAWVAWKHFYAKNAVPAIRSIAVLPMQNLSADAAQQYFADGMTDELITDLAKVSALRVISRTSVMRYKDTKKGLPEIARELNVDAIVEGSVMRSGNRVRITAQLLHAPTDKHLWADTYERDLGDVLRLQNEVAQTIAQQVRAQLTPQQEARFRSARVVNPEAYEAYLRGRYYLSNQYTMAQPLNMAKSYFEESIRKDPGFALAYSGLADSYVYLAFYGRGLLPPDRAYKSAKEALRKAVELDDSIGEIHDTLGLLNWRFEWNWDAAEREFNRAIALAPSYSCAHEDRADYLSFMGRRADALAEIAKSNELDPGPSSAMTESAAYYQLREYESLVEAGRRGVASYPNEWVEHRDLGAGYEGTGKPLEAISEYEKAIEMSNGDPDVSASLAHAFAAIGRKPEAEKILRDLERKAKSAYVSPYTIATVYAGLGQKDKAFEWLERAYQQRSLDLSWYIKADLRIDNLRSDPRFEALLRGIGLPPTYALPVPSTATRIFR
ncbi:MAG TPA: winged helix-turn-helix domain-containing protein [Candidatus Dormibacteraeota bacterium]|nr:winged helix-turn-helix domain-containing protein [Candidatus Dormibacteraeota bacterium]